VEFEEHNIMGTQGSGYVLQKEVCGWLKSPQAASYGREVDNAH